MTADKTDASFFARHEFLILRLHSLTGLIPVGAYMVVHLLTNASVMAGAAAFQNSVFQIHSLGPLLPLVEWVFIFLPLLFHGIVGLVIIRRGVINTSQYTFASNVRYTLQRATGMIAFVFIMWHVFHMHGWLHSDSWLANIAGPLGGAKFRPYNAASSAGAAMQQSPLILAIYAVGVLSSVFHLANGLWTMGITWGLWTTPQAQARANWIAVAVGLFLTIVSVSAITGFATINVPEARKIEDEAYEARVSSHMIEPDEHKRTHDQGDVHAAGSHTHEHAEEHGHDHGNTHDPVISGTQAPTASEPSPSTTPAPSQPDDATPVSDQPDVPAAGPGNEEAGGAEPEPPTP
ncbi:succinate dehydrogenase cytochrome b558 subunit [Lignipirellula cremea]|uniref:Succinate dehydrogenase cytochrome b558 subunit n=1 Tax=Lignipirellula cremea TaxID=2528010 RepID=A0A518DUZ7_9BACT|nr:succinate dehydrogenase cytochrome b558 subunit [Lignipirellula cremea]QDU95647.1 Succinate dehydrogenase cytochrome b558 subunit [Lignipirellula cremea]